MKMKAKKWISAFLAAVMAVTMLFAGSVTAGAANSPYSVEYDSSFVMEGMDGTQEVLTVKGLTYEQYTAYMDRVNNGIGELYLGVKFSNDVIFIVAWEPRGVYTVTAPENDGGRFKAISTVGTGIVLNDDGAPQSVEFVFFLNKETLSDSTRKLLNQSSKCTVSLCLFLPDGSVTYLGDSGYTFESDYQVISSTSKSISSLSATVKNQTYTGKARTPDVTIKDGSKTLKKGTDYTLTYKNNKKIGTASVTIKGKGDYSGEQTLTFKIVPKKTTLTAKKSGEKVTLKWDAVKGAEKYVIYYREKSESKYKKLTTVSGSKTSYSTSKLDKNKTYQFKIRSYAESGGKKVYSSYSKVVTTK